MRNPFGDFERIDNRRQKSDDLLDQLKNLIAFYALIQRFLTSVPRQNSLSHDPLTCVAKYLVNEIIRRVACKLKRKIFTLQHIRWLPKNENCDEGR